MNTLVIVIFCLVIVIAALETLHFIERRDLYDRLMSRDLNEYRRAKAKGGDEAPRVSGHTKTIREWREMGNATEKNNG